MSDLTGVKVGDELLLIERYNRSGRAPIVVTVAKVGTKLVHIEVDGGTYTYRIDTGARNDNYGHIYLITREEYEEVQVRDGLENSLRSAGVELRFGVRKFSTAKLRALLAVMEDEAL